MVLYVKQLGMGCVCHLLSCIIVQGLYFVNWFLCLNQFIRELNVDQSESSDFSEALWRPSLDLISKINTHTLTNSVWQTQRVPLPPSFCPHPLEGATESPVLAGHARRVHCHLGVGGHCAGFNGARVRWRTCRTHISSCGSGCGDCGDGAVFWRNKWSAGDVSEKSLTCFWRKCGKCCWLTVTILQYYNCRLCAILTSLLLSNS